MRYKALVQMKVTCSTGLEVKDVRRVKRLADADQSTEAHILRKAVLAGLPNLEREVLGEDFIGGAKAKNEGAGA